MFCQPIIFFDFFLATDYPDKQGMKTTNLFFTLILAGCTTTWVAPPQFVPQRIKTDDFTLQTYQKNTDSASPVHIYIEGDGHAFDAYGNPTNNPTPHNTLVRDLAAGNAIPPRMLHILHAHANILCRQTATLKIGQLDAFLNPQ